MPSRQPAVGAARTWTRRRVLRAGGLAGATALLGGGAYAYSRLHGYGETMLHWWRRRREDVPAEAFVLVALGDSSTQGFGAARVDDSFVGRAEAHVRACTGRFVHVVNVAGGAGTVDDVLVRQLAAADLGAADLVLVSVGTNDVGAGTTLGNFRSRAERLLAALPRERTVVSDVIRVPGYEPYRDALARAADRHGVRRADVNGAFEAARRYDVMADDGVHVNSLGYGIWFDAFRPRIDEVLREAGLSRRSTNADPSTS